MNDPLRSGANHEFASLYNFRDVGGLPTTGGKRIRRGVLFRSDSFHEASRDDIDYLVNSVRLRCIIDLRSEREFAAEGNNPLIPASVETHRFPIAGGPGGAIEGAPSGMRLAARYVEYLRDHAASIVGAVQAIAQADSRAAAVHCRAGKDRTGVVIAMILGSLGVLEDAIAQDYALTTLPMQKILARLRSSPTYAANVSRLPAEMYSSEASTMTMFLQQLQRQQGGAARWLLANGLPESALDALRENLIDQNQTGEPA